MDSKGATPKLLQAVWIATSFETCERTSLAWSSRFEMEKCRLVFPFEPSQIASLTPGVTVFVELPEESSLIGRCLSESVWTDIISSIVDVSCMPIIVCIGHQVPAQTVVDWLRSGVFTYLERNATLGRYQEGFLDCSYEAHKVRSQLERYGELRYRWDSISDREAVVLELLLEGVPNKTIANRLGVSQRTIETRRHNLYEKLESKCVAEVVKVIYELDNLSRIFRRFQLAHRPSLRLPHFDLKQKPMRPLPLLRTPSDASIV